MSTNNRVSVDAPRSRIFYFVDSLNLGGSEVQLVQTACRLDRSRFEVTVGCLRSEGPLLESLSNAAIEVREFSPGKSIASYRGLLSIFRLARYMRQKRFDIVQTFDLYSNLVGIPAAWLARVPLRISNRRDLGRWWWYTPRNRKILREIVKLSHVTVVNSAAIRDLVVTQDHYPAAKVIIVRNGVDTDALLRIRANRNGVLPNLCSNDRVITVVANMNSERKGHADLIEAAKTVCSSMQSAKFVLVGDGAERASLEGKVIECGLAGKVIFVGRRTDTTEILKCSNISVLPSWAEGLPNVVLEAMAVGVPVVATRVGGIPEIIENETHGLLVPPRDPKSLADAILRLLRDETLAVKLACAGQERVKADFSFARVLEELCQLYHMAEGKSQRA